MSFQTADTPLYSDLASDPDLKDIVEMFVEEMPDRISMLLTQIENNDLEGLRQTAHQLKGAAGSYGFNIISPQAGEVEDKIREGCNAEQIHQSVNDLVSLCRRVTAEAPQ